MIQITIICDRCSRVVSSVDPETAFLSYKVMSESYDLCEECTELQLAAIKANLDDLEV